MCLRNMNASTKSKMTFFCIKVVVKVPLRSFRLRPSVHGENVEI